MRTGSPGNIGNAGVQIEPDDIGQLGVELRVAAELEGFDPGRREPMRGRFRIACGSRERSKPRIRPTTKCTWPQSRMSNRMCLLFPATVTLPPDTPRPQ